MGDLESGSSALQFSTPVLCHRVRSVCQCTLSVIAEGEAAALGPVPRAHWQVKPTPPGWPCWLPAANPKEAEFRGAAELSRDYPDRACPPAPRILPALITRLRIQTAGGLAEPPVGTDAH